MTNASKYRSKESWLPWMAMLLLGMIHGNHSLPLHSFSHIPPAVAAAHHTVLHTSEREGLVSSPSSVVQDAALLLSAMERNSPLQVQTQSQQMNEAMVIKTMRGTQWRVIEDRVATSSSFGQQFPLGCKSLATFSGFASEDNKGTVNVQYTCGDGDGDGDSASPTSASGRWVTKPSRLARGSIQLSARWKVRVPGGGTVIYKGFIDADRIIGRAGKSVAAEMAGVLLTGEEVNKEKVVGKFTADFVRQLDDREQDALKIGGAKADDGPILLVPKN